MAWSLPRGAVSAGISYRSVREARSAEEAVQQGEEQRDDDEQHERREVTEDEREHQLALDLCGGLDRGRSLRRARRIASISDHRDRAVPEATRSFQRAGQRRESREALRLRGCAEGAVQRS